HGRRWQMKSLISGKMEETMSVRLMKQVAGLTLALMAAIALPSGAQGASVKGPNGTIEIEVSNGTLIQLSQPASSVFIADPEVADLQVKSPRMVYVFGKKAGSTSLYALSGKDEVLYSGTIRVN